jgi:hypothetical protein
MRAAGVDGPCDYEIVVPPPPPPPPTKEQQAAIDEGHRIGEAYGQFEADLEQMNTILFRKWGGKSTWDAMNDQMRQEVASKVIARFNTLPQLTDTFRNPELGDFALRGFNEGRQSVYSSSHTWNTITNFLVDMAPFIAMGVINAFRKVGASVVVDLFGGARSQIPNAINVDIAATSGIRADITKGVPLPTAVADEVIVTNPYIKGLQEGANASNTWLSEAARLTRPGGRITVTGALNANKFARLPVAAELEKVGLKVVEAPHAVTDTRILAQKLFTTDGTPLDISKLQSYVLEKVK